MERSRSDLGSASPMETVDGIQVRPSPPRHPPNYNSNIVQDALEHLASIDLIELCNEAKIERCRATRDLSSCGRYVQHVLNSCGHASLCAECGQRCDVCPICRTSISNSGSRVRLRLYYKCIEAGLISKRHDDRFQEKEDTGEYMMADIQRLYSLFDVALENNLVSLICHYVTDVCMDETAVSSDPILAFLLDEVVVKDWCKRMFKIIINELHRIYSHGVEAMKLNQPLFQKFSLQLTGISNVLEVMDSSFKGTSSAQLHDLHYLLENILRAKQHLEVMTWCTRHQFLEDVQPRHPDFPSWTSHVHERKSAALKRSWPDTTSNMEDPAGDHDCSLFIEQALSNLLIEPSFMDNNEEVDIFCLQDRSSPLIFDSTINAADKTVTVGCYPFKSLRAAIDILFLYGTSDMVVAKQAILLYYLFDRHWTKPDEEWRHLVDDFATSFGLSRHLVLESLVFYLLDDHTDQSLQDACNLLPEIASPETHQKVAQILLERQWPDVALSVLRCTGRDAFCAHRNSKHDIVHCVTLAEAVTAVRVRIECGLLTEAFMCQRMHCSKVKEGKAKIITSTESSNIRNSDSWAHQIEVLVTELCYLCIRRNLVDRMIELPWDSYEEKYLHKCLFDHACQDPSTVYGSLLVVFYLQRYRYKEAYQVDCKLRNLEKNVLESTTIDVASKIRSISQWRAKLVDKCLKLLPEVQRLQVMTGDMTDNDVPPSLDVQMSSESDFPDVLLNPSTSGTPMPIKSSLVLHTNFNQFTSSKPSADANVNTISSTSNANMELGTKVPSILQRRLFASETPTIARMNPFVDGISTLNANVDVNSVSGVNIARDYRREDGVRQGFQSIRSVRPIQSVSPHVPLNELNRSALGVGQDDNQFHVGKSSYGMESFDCTGNVENSLPFVPKVNSEDSNDLMDSFHNNGFLNNSICDQNLKVSGKQNLLDRPWNKVFSEEANRNTWSFGDHDSAVLDANAKGGLRWRSDESTDDDVDDGPDKNTLTKSSFVTRRRARFSR